MASVACCWQRPYSRKDRGDPAQVAPLLGQIDAGIDSVRFDGACDVAPSHDAGAARAGDIPVIMAL